MGTAFKYPVDEKLKKKVSPKIRAATYSWKKGRLLRTAMASVAAFILSAAVIMMLKKGKADMILFVLSGILFLAWYFLRVIHSREALISVKWMDNELIEIDSESLSYSYRTNFPGSNSNHDAIIITILKKDIRKVVRYDRPARIEVFGTFKLLECDPDALLNRHIVALGDSDGEHQNGNLIFFNYFNKSDELFRKIQEFG